jgi:hypothetical protein
VKFVWSASVFAVFSSCQDGSGGDALQRNGSSGAAAQLNVTSPRGGSSGPISAMLPVAEAAPSMATASSPPATVQAPSSEIPRLLPSTSSTAAIEAPLQGRPRDLGVPGNSNSVAHTAEPQEPPLQVVDAPSAVPALSFPSRETATALSQRAASLADGDSRETVIRKLGPPTWAVVPSDTGDFALEPSVALSLLWDNGECSPVEVWFDRRMRSNGASEGRICGLGELGRPDARYSCKRKDRQKFCR